MSPAHIHQYAASLSPGQLSESLPSSQVIVFVLFYVTFSFEILNVVSVIYVYILSTSIRLFRFCMPSFHLFHVQPYANISFCLRFIFSLKLSGNSIAL